MALRSLRLRSPNRRLGREWSRWTKRVMPEPASPASPLLLPIECKYQSGSLSLSLHETPNINIALVPRFSGKPRGNSVRSGDRSDQRSPPKQSSEPPTFRMPTRPNLMRPRGPRLPRDSALDAMKDILDIRRGVFETVHGRKQKTTRTQARAGNHDAGKTEPKMGRNSAKMAEEQPRPGHGLLPSRRAAVHRSTGVPSITQMASTPLLVRPDVATKTHAPDPQIRSDWETAT